MNKLSGVPWWTSIGFLRGASQPDDFADMGTAFGLDASMTADEADEAPVLESDVARVVDRLNGRSVI